MYLGDIAIPGIPGIGTQPFVLATSGGSNDAAWWEEPVQNLANAASGWVSEQISPSVSPYGPSVYGGMLEQPPAPPVLELEPVSAGIGAGTVLLLGGLAFLALRRR